MTSRPLVRSRPLALPECIVTRPAAGKRLVDLADFFAEGAVSHVPRIRLRSAIRSFITRWTVPPKAVVPKASCSVR